MTNTVKVSSYYKIFPYLKNKNKLLQLKIDDDSLHFISTKYTAGQITSIIINYLKYIKKSVEDVTVIDATAGVGGNSISFGMNFSFVYAIELEKLRCKYLKNNIDVYDLNNVKPLQGDCIEVLKKINIQDVVFIDPPWGGKDYKLHKKLRLSLSDKTIEQFCNELFHSDEYICNPEIVVLKLPNNYDIHYLYTHIKESKIYIHKLKKMIIAVLIKVKVQNLFDK